jgi:hypothetical protein
MNFWPPVALPNLMNFGLGERTSRLSLKEFKIIRVNNKKWIPLFEMERKKELWGKNWGPLPNAVMSEWLRRLTRNQLGFARAGSNPADCEYFFPTNFKPKLIYFVFIYLNLFFFNFTSSEMAIPTLQLNALRSHRSVPMQKCKEWGKVPKKWWKMLREFWWRIVGRMMMRMNAFFFLFALWIEPLAFLMNEMWMREKIGFFFFPAKSWKMRIKLETVQSLQRKGQFQFGVALWNEWEDARLPVYRFLWVTVELSHFIPMKIRGKWKKP